MANVFSDAREPDPPVHGGGVAYLSETTCNPASSPTSSGGSSGTSSPEASTTPSENDAAIFKITMLVVFGGFGLGVLGLM